MTVRQIVLRHGIQFNANIGSFSAIYAEEDSASGSPEVLVNIAADGEREYVLHPGDTFTVRDQTWKLASVNNPGLHDWTVVLERVD
ncbi:DUF6406 domain-containing protein [Actinoallomurus iriomotensis]|uniref:Uncharacterized protein n=1 Tax=Actinoallomurus iriomotensis TaxID=478107 RepID=A0A9W6RSZ4_9ACTN|nr:hypothetical protein Airi01_093870 [Actinoallomurus iriomotensis]